MPSSFAEERGVEHNYYRKSPHGSQPFFVPLPPVGALDPREAPPRFDIDSARPGGGR